MEQGSFDPLLSSLILPWYDCHGRKDLPWKKSNPYFIYLSEIMLQQTQVATVIPYFEKFTAKWPSIAALAASSLDEVLSMWAGLGYYRRAHHLYEAVQEMHHAYKDQVPNNYEALLSLKGIGESTAGAIMAMAHHQRYAILDANVKRVLCRFLGLEAHAQTKVNLWQHARRFTPFEKTAAYTQAIMDIGASLCSIKKPQCGPCPLQQHCQAYQKQQFELYKVPSKKIAKKSFTKTMFALSNTAGDLLLYQRSGVGIWPKLWCLPIQEELEETFAGAMAKATGGVSAQSYGPYKHVFTHQVWHYQVLHYVLDQEFALPEGYQWCDQERLRQYAFPAPISEWISSIFLPMISPETIRE